MTNRSTLLAHRQRNSGNVCAAYARGLVVVAMAEKIQQSMKQQRIVRVCHAGVEALLNHQNTTAYIDRYRCERDDE